MPLDGGIVLPQNALVEPLISEIMFNAILDNWVLGGLVRSNSLPRGHADLNGGHPGLSENLFKRVVITEVFPTSSRPQVVENKAT